MNRNLVPKFILILILVVLAALTLYPPSATLKPGIDLAGGTSLIYAIDTEGLSADEQKDLAQKMITVLRRRIDPANIQNLVWRPLGNTRFEIQMPLASKETAVKRDEFQAAIDELDKKNVNPAVIMRALKQPPEQRSEELTRFAQGDPNHQKILNNLASVSDERQQVQQQRDVLTAQVQATAEKIKAAGLDLARIDANRWEWGKLNQEALVKALTDFLGPKVEAPNLALVQTYIQDHAKLANALNQLTAPGGLNERYVEARKQLDQLSLTRERITSALELTPESKRATEIAALKSRHPDRVEEIDRVVVAYDGYRPFQGRLDDPADLRRMLKGAGILEFRILPTRGRPELSEAEMQQYLEALASKGPKAASDSQYVWVEIESIEEWGQLTSTIVGQFGDKYYVLASNRVPDEAMLHRAGARDWKLESANPTHDEYGRRAIGFGLDLKGGDLFYNVTSKNQNRPLAIILDDRAISAPNINSAIRNNGIITGSFTPTQVSDMVDKLNAGSLPARMIEQPISERVIGPSIGADNRDQGIKSGVIGLIMVVAFMMVYYFVGGAIADAALMLNILFTLAVMAGIRATFTLPGIAGMILTIGMSVDANVLIFERIREEQAKGLGLVTAIKNGYQRALSAILDSNLTTILTAAILYFVASEDVKGFAIVLMLGIGSSMFTAIFVTRAILDLLVSKRIIKNHLPMLQLIKVPNIDWMKMRPVFFTISAVLVFGGLILFLARDRSKYDIEFTGGTSVQIALKEGESLTRQDVEDRMVAVAEKLNNADLRSANVYSVGDPIGRAANGERIYSQYEITTVAANRLLTTVTFGQDESPAADTVAATLRKAQAQSGSDLGDIRVTPGSERSFTITTGRVNPTMVQNLLKETFPQAQVAEPKVQEVAADAIRQAFGRQLAVQQNLNPTIASATRITEQSVETYPELAPYIGGIKIDTSLGTAASVQEIDRRLKDLTFRPDTQDLASYSHQIFGADLKPVEPGQPVNAFTFVSVHPEAGLRELSEQEWTQFVDNEQTRVLQATQRETSLPRVVQIDPFIGSEARTRAIISIVLSLAAIVAYIWLRFGTLRFGLAAIVALFHDVAVALGAVAVSAFLASTFLGQALLIGDFRINSTIIAAILTLLGYSLNDTIVVFDRIRENRRKVQLTARSVTDSINQTLSRTMITGITTFMVVGVMYIFGGSGLRGFNFVIFLGLVVGTYSSIAIAAPMLLVGLRNQQEKARPAVKIEGVRRVRAKPESAL